LKLPYCELRRKKAEKLIGEEEIMHNLGICKEISDVKCKLGEKQMETLSETNQLVGVLLLYTGKDHR
jgi:hypothetical protein